MSCRVIKSIVAAALIVAAPTLARAQTVAYGASSPIVVTEFRVAGGNSPWTTLGGYAVELGMPTANVEPASVALRFVNKTDVPATGVTFVINSGRESLNIVDKGTFTPGVPIEHTFVGFDGLRELSKATLKVAEVDFADGTAWHGVDAEADERESRRREVQQLNADARRVAFRHLGTSQ